MKPTLLILAAGIGSRYGGLKQLDPIGPSGETIIDYSIYDAIRAGFGKVIFIIKENIEQEFKETFIRKLQDKIEIDYVFQEIWMVPEGIQIPDNRDKPWGTGHAVMMAEGKINEPFAVINADDFYGEEAYRSIASYYQNWTPEREPDFCMVGYQLANTLSEFGAVSRGICQPDTHANLVNVVERSFITRQKQGIVFKNETGDLVPIKDETLVSMNFWGFTPSFFEYLKKGFAQFIKDNNQNLKSEFFIPTVVNELIHEKKMTVKILTGGHQWFGMTYKQDREMVVKKIRSLINQGIYPENLWA
ncbi:MAG: sugar phosphate nucleotidyltransferase [Bacteroidales bacterium]|nr:sugar phosphate nucleotidyltransferase [Bacteroidales bacterium]MDD4602717.1 sugar phosphate nucleotidyltransferase [Bacteroidales bacterium]